MIHYLFLFIFGLLLLNVWMYLQQPAMTFYPVSELESTPANWGLDYEDVNLQTSDGVAIHGWYIPYENAKQVLLFFHGNAGNISHRRHSIEAFHRLGLNVLIVDYRGYGLSEGSPGESGLYRDATAAWSYLIEEKGFAENHVVIFGRSLGGAVAADLASKVSASGLILESTMSSARDFSHAVFPILSRLIIMRYDFNSAKKIPSVNYPVLVLHSPDDEIMPFHLGKSIFETANEPKQFMQMRGGHNNGFYLSQPEYEQTLKNWLKTLH